MANNSYTVLPRSQKAKAVAAGFGVMLATCPVGIVHAEKDGSSNLFFLDDVAQKSFFRATRHDLLWQKAEVAESANYVNTDELMQVAAEGGFDDSLPHRFDELLADFAANSGGKGIRALFDSLPNAARVRLLRQLPGLGIGDSTEVHGLLMDTYLSATPSIRCGAASCLGQLKEEWASDLLVQMNKEEKNPVVRAIISAYLG